jgi:hypothetical protein
MAAEINRDAAPRTVLTNTIRKSANAHRMAELDRLHAVQQVTPTSRNEHVVAQ